MNTLVSFEIAKLLKEKSFEQKERSSYLLVPFSECTQMDTFGHDVDKLNVGDIIGYYLPDKTINAPTCAEVVMWLYDEYGIWIDVSTIKWNFDDNTIRFAYHITVYIDKSPSDNINSRFDYSSPTEAYIAAIEYTLNNLI